MLLNLDFFFDLSNETNLHNFGSNHDIRKIKKNRIKPKMSVIYIDLERDLKLT